MTRTRAQEHFKVVSAQEMTQLEKREIENKASSLRYAGAAVRNIVRGKSTYTSKVHPRLGLRLLASAFKDLTDKANDYKLTNEFISNDLLPLCGIAPDPANGIRVQAVISGNNKGSCLHAENGFKQCLAQIGKADSKGQPNISVYHTPNGVPLAFRKKRVESTALTLEPLAFIPQGAIVSVDKSMNTVKTGEQVYPNYSLQTFEVDGALAILPLRLSAWAYPTSQDRSLFAISSHGGISPQFDYDSKRARLVCANSLDDFRQAAHQVMALCGVESAIPQDLAA